MRIKSVVPRPYEKSIPPGLSFEVDIEHVNLQEAIVGISGSVESDDGKVLARVESEPEKTEISELGARDSVHDSKITQKVYRTRLFAPLDAKTLSYIDERRMANEKGDVYLALNLNIKSIVTRAIVSHFHEIDSAKIGLPPDVPIFSSSGRRREGKILAYGHDSHFSTDFTNRWISARAKKLIYSKVGFLLIFLLDIIGAPVSRS